MSPSESTSVDTSQRVPERLIVVGWLIMHRLEHGHEEAVLQARSQMLAFLQEQFAQFQWEMPVVRRAEPSPNSREEPIRLLQEGVHERDIHHWDYALVITGADLRSYYKPYALAAPSLALSVAVLSLARLAPAGRGTLLPEEHALSQTAQRLYALGLHVLGDLSGLLHAHEPTDFLYEPRSTADLDRMSTYSSEDHQELAEELSAVADIRLEERPEAEQSGLLRFYSKAIWIEADAIVRAILQAKPWEFPFRLNRLTTAAISTLMLLLMTAEAWDVGMGQSLHFVLTFSLLALLGTSVFILKRQKLLLRRGGRRLTEQTVVTNVAISIVVLLGMTTTYLLLFALTLLLSGTLFNPSLLQGWAVSVGGVLTLPHYLSHAGLVAALGIMIGALGASFEGQYYFQHITYVDEET